MSHYIEGVHAINWCTNVMRLIIIQSQRQSLPIFGQFPSVQNYSLIRTFPSEDRIMALASMHSMFQVSVNLCDHSSPNYVWKIHVHNFTYSCACQAEATVNGELKLQSRICISYWNLEFSARVAILESKYVSLCKLQPFYFVTSSFGKAFTVIGGNLAPTIVLNGVKSQFIVTSLYVVL
jgi:hypothetical protein